MIIYNQSKPKNLKPKTQTIRNTQSIYTTNKASSKINNWVHPPKPQTQKQTTKNPAISSKR